MNKYLKGLQGVSKAGKIISTIVFIISIVGGGMCLLGILLQSIFGNIDLVFLKINIHGLVEGIDNIKGGISGAYIYMINGTLICAGEAVLSKFAEIYFRHELADGTPFTMAGGREMLRLGILTLCIPVGVNMIVEIITAAASIATGTALKSVTDYTSTSIGLGLVFIIFSVVCKYGSTLEENNNIAHIK